AFEPANAKRTTDNSKSLKDENRGGFEIAFEGSLGVSPFVKGFNFEKGVNNGTPFSITSVLMANTPPGTTINYNGEQVPVIPTQPDSQPLQLQPGELFGIGVSGINEIGI